MKGDNTSVNLCDTYLALCELEEVVVNKNVLMTPRVTMSWLRVVSPNSIRTHIQTAQPLTIDLMCTLLCPFLEVTCHVQHIGVDRVHNFV